MADQFRKNWPPFTDDGIQSLPDIVKNPPWTLNPPWDQKMLDEVKKILDAIKKLEERIDPCPCYDPQKDEFLKKIQEALDAKKKHDAEVLDALAAEIDKVVDELNRLAGSKRKRKNVKKPAKKAKGRGKVKNKKR